MALEKPEIKLIQFLIPPLFAVIFLGLGYSFTKQVLSVKTARNSSMRPIPDKKTDLPKLDLETLITSQEKKDQIKPFQPKSETRTTGLSPFKTQPIKQGISKVQTSVNQKKLISQEAIARYKKARSFFSNQNVNELFQKLTEP